MRYLSLTLLFFSLSLPTHADVSFQKKKIKIGGQILTVEIADTPEKSARGLMFRRELPPGNGMLFVFQDEQVRSFWMKNTFIPLSIGFFNKKKELIDIQEMAPVQSEMQMDLPTYASKGPAQYVLEVPKGWFSQNKIGLKQRFLFQ